MRLNLIPLGALAVLSTSVAQGQEAVAQDPLILSLVCKGTRPDTEVVRGEATTSDGRGGDTSADVSIRRAVRKPEEIRFTINGVSGQIVYSDGRTRAFTDADISPTRIIAKYVLKSFLMSTTIRMEIDRTTGEAKTFHDRFPNFNGTCERASTVAKF